jgi:hypothetical protein
MLVIILQQIIKAASTWSRIRIDAQTASPPRFGGPRLIQSQEGRSADGRSLFGYRGMPRSGRGPYRRLRIGRRGGCRRKGLRWRSGIRRGSRGGLQQRGSAHSAEAVRPRVFISAAGAAHQASSTSYSLRYLGSSMHRVDRGSIRKMTAMARLSRRLTA